MKSKFCSTVLFGDTSPPPHPQCYHYQLTGGVTNIVFFECFCVSYKEGSVILPIFRQKTSQAITSIISVHTGGKAGASIQIERMFIIIITTVTVKTKVQGRQSPSQKFHKNSQVPGYGQRLVDVSIYHQVMKSCGHRAPGLQFMSCQIGIQAILAMF